MGTSGFAILVVCLEIVVIAIGHPVMAALFLTFNSDTNESSHIQVFLSFILPIPAATFSMVYLLVLGIRQRNSEHLQSWFVLQCLLVCWMIKTTTIYMISAGPSPFLIGTLVVYMTYKPVVIFLVHAFNIEVRKENASPEICDASVAKAVFYMEIFIILGYTARIIYKFVVEDFMTSSILLIFMCIYAGFMVLFTEMLHIGIYEKHRGKLKWWIFLSYLGCLVQLVVGGINFYMNFNELLWINHLLFSLYKAWSVYVITGFRSTLEREDMLDVPMTMSDDRPGNNSQRQDWLYASAPIVSAYYGANEQVTNASYL